MSGTISAVIVNLVRSALALVGLLIVWSLAGSAQASAASCPTQTFLNFNELAYAAIRVPAAVHLSSGSAVGTGAIDEPTSANGCKRRRVSARLLALGSVDPRVAVLVSGLPRIAFVIGSRCSGFVGAAYWECLTRPLSFHQRSFTATSYPTQPSPQRTLPLGAALGTASYHGRPVTVRRINGVDPVLAVGISGQPSTAFLSPSTCPYSGFSNTPQYDNLLRCLRAPVWFTFQPPESEAGGNVLARSDRPVSARIAGAPVSLVQLPVVADFVPPSHGPLKDVGRVADHASLHIPGDVPPGLYEAVVSCPACGSEADGGATLFPAGSILVTPKPRSSPAIRIVSIAIAAAFVLALIFTFRTREARAGVLRGLESFLMGTGRRGSSRRP